MSTQSKGFSIGGHAFTLRPANDADYEALYALHVATMKDYVAVTYGWEDATQRAIFKEDWEPRLGGLQVLLAEEEIIGALRTENRDDSLYLASIEISPSHQSKGIGTGIVKRLLADAAGQGLPTSLSVMKANPRARVLYERLGFAVRGETSTHFEMVSG